MSRRLQIIIVGVLASIAMVIGGCSDQLTDLKGIEIQDPDTVSVYRNVDNFPNVAIMCIDGDALIMRSSNYDDMMILHIPDNDNNLCE